MAGRKRRSGSLEQVEDSKDVDSADEDKENAGSAIELSTSSKKSKQEVTLTINQTSTTDENDFNNENIDFGSTPIYVGELPGLAALKGGLGMEESPVAVVLGMDVLRKRPSMLLRALQNEVWFE